MASIFTDKSEKPDDKMLAADLGRSYKYWEQIQKALKEQYGGITPEWKFYPGSSAWTLKMLLKKRNLFFFGPREKHFMIAFVFGDKAVRAIEESGLPPALIEEVRNSKRYPEGRALRIEVRKKDQVNFILKLTETKVNN
jgi:hypothetical protein